MRCNKSELIASVHLDQQLMLAEARRYEAHVELCAECRTRFVELEQISLILKSARRPAASPELRSYVMSVIAAK